MKTILSSVLVFLTFSFSLSASDVQREGQYAEALGNTLKKGKKVMLKAGENDFLALYMETETVENKGTAILLHDMGGHPDQQYVIHALRTQFPGHGWATLSLQLPIREVGALAQDYLGFFPEAALRIKASIDYLQNTGIKNIVLVGYGLGALMAIYYHSENPSGPINAIAAISLPIPETDIETAQTQKFLEQLQIPLLDIYAGQDLPDVINNVRKKRLASNKNQKYRQVKIVSADHSYMHNQGLLVKRIYSWLSRVLKKSVR